MKNKKLIIATIVWIVLAALVHYVMCPPINIKSQAFFNWLMITAILAFVAYSGAMLSIDKNTIQIVRDENKRKSAAKSIWSEKGTPRAAKIAILTFCGLLVLELLGTFFSGRLFHAKAYSQILQVEEGSVEDIPSSDETDAIALMDTASARMLGDRKIGSLAHVVSQYELWNNDYMQINRGNRPVKVAPLSYGGLIKWLINRSSGVPGYVSVDPVSMEADYVELPEGMHIVPSAYFGEDLVRYLRYHYPTKMFYDPHFEVDEEGKPWYVAPVYTHSVFLFGGTKVIGSIVLDPVSGQSEYYKLADIPDWVDIAIPGTLICTQYNDYAQLMRGYWNSVFGQVGCREVTRVPSGEGEESSFEADFGYIAKDNDIYIYTGITSVNGDSSNIGFIMANERTGRTVYFDAPGANEFSATSAAEGEVQEKRYQASFPSLISVDDVPTYIMVLKDKTGLVKMYACVNVEQYNMVATSANQKDCIAKYQALLRGNISPEEANKDDGYVPEDDLSQFEKKTVTVARLQTIDRGGDTYLYLVDEEGNIYSAKYVDVIDMLLVHEGDEIDIYVKGDEFRYQYVPKEGLG